MEQILRSLCHLYFSAIRQRLLPFSTQIADIIGHLDRLTEQDGSIRLSGDTSDLLLQVDFLRRFQNLSAEDQNLVLSKAKRVNAGTAADENSVN
jgi:hypothetical protein